MIFALTATALLLGAFNVLSMNRSIARVRAVSLDIDATTEVALWAITRAQDYLQEVLQSPLEASRQTTYTT